MGHTMHILDKTTLLYRFLRFFPWFFPMPSSKPNKVIGLNMVVYINSGTMLVECSNRNLQMLATQPVEFEPGCGHEAGKV